MFAAWLTLAVAAIVAAPAQRHPEPRVVVDVRHVEGPHDRSEVQREARSFLWGRIIRCYRAAAASNPKLKGETLFALRVEARGEVTGVRKTGGNIDDEEVVACWAREIEQVPMPKANGRSKVVLELHVAPGDPPRR